jgi:two-component system sensor histidine kinase KdpD
MRVSVPSRILRLAVSLGIVGGIIAVCVSVPHVHAASVVLLLLLAVVITAGRWGFVEAATATGVGAVLLAYFSLPPRGFGVKSPEYWMVVVTFLGVALLASYLAAQAKRQTDEAVARRREIEKLYALGQDLRMEDAPGSIVAAYVNSLVRIFQLDAAAFYDVGTGEITRSGPKASLISEGLLRDVTHRPDRVRQNGTTTVCVPLHSGGQVVGSLAVCGGSVSEIIFRAIADRIGAGLARVSAYEKLRQAQETQRNQELKTALLDSLVHEIKTPLSVIKTAVSSLLSRDSDPAGRRELLTIINEEADRLDASISEVFWTARVEAGMLQSGKGPHDIRPLVNETLDELKPLLGSRPVVMEVPDSLPPANCDSSMIKGVVKELLTNALKYSPSDSPLTVSVQQAGDEIVTSITDCGIGIRPGEEKLIFQKHYRGSVRAPGTGLGLALAKTIVEAHGGRIGVESKAGVGSVFHFSLPLSHRDVA